MGSSSDHRTLPGPLRIPQDRGPKVKNAEQHLTSLQVSRTLQDVPQKVSPTFTFPLMKIPKNKKSIVSKASNEEPWEWQGDRFSRGNANCSVHTHASSSSQFSHIATPYNKITHQNTTRKHIKPLLPMAL